MHRIKPLCPLITSLLFFAGTCLAQQKPTRYNQLWAKVDSLALRKGLPKSALAEVNNIYILAKKEKQEAQFVKALVYRMSLEEIVKDSPDTRSLQMLENEINTATEPSRSILYSILALKYYYYYLAKGMQFDNRTNTINFKKTDIATWSGKDFVEKISDLYLASIKNKSLLQKTMLEPYNPIIMQGNVRYLRPTLYDLLAYPAIDCFQRLHTWASKPAAAFEMSNDNLFAPAPTFARLKIPADDTASLFRKALSIYQDLLAFHLADAKPDALVDADISRLQFVHTWGVMPQKDSLFEKALGALADRYAGVPGADQASYLVADMHVSPGTRYNLYGNNDDDTDTTDMTFAAAICKKVLQQPGAESEGKINCYNLLKTIEQQSLHLSTEKINVPGQPFRTLVSYRNFTSLYLRLIPVSNRQREQLDARRNDTGYWKYVLRLSPLRTWSQPLPVTNDYRKHSTEIKIDGAPTGQYILLAGVRPGFAMTDNLVSAQLIYISNISYINNGNEYFVLDRETGQPLGKTTAQLWWREYNTRSRNYNKIKGPRLVTDEHGYVKIPGRRPSYNEMQLYFYHDNDSLCISEYEYNTLAEEVSTPLIDSTLYEKDNAEMHFFTDRSIYRPGQTIYFKGIGTTKDRHTGKSKPYAGKASRVILSDVNGTDIDSLLLTTNEFGSYSGRFKLPANLLNGEFSLRDKELYGRLSFSVEEYKRPKFYVQFDTIHGSYRINDSITITGFAKGYAGNAINGAQVSYRVQRVTRFIYPWMFSSRRMPYSSGQEITKGIISTAPDGSFRLRFKAIPDSSTGKELDPVFDYAITADITDGSGETHSAANTVTVSYKAIRLSIQLTDDESIPVDKFRSVQINTNNNAGEFVPAPATITITRLQAPNRLIRERFWPQPDRFIMSKEEYLASFPVDEYKDESKQSSWPKEAIAWQAAGSTSPDKQYSIPNTLKQGWYMVEATAHDINGDSVKDIKYIRLYDEKSNTLDVPSYTWSKQEIITVEPGEPARLQIGSSATGLFVIQQVDKDTNNEKAAPVYNFLTLNNEKKNIVFTPGEADRGGFGVYHLFVKNNRFYSLAHTIAVPWSNQYLTISYSSFRDKTLPGSEEKWRLNISGPKKEKVAAEMLASMYDASLDQFQPHQWRIPDLFGNYSLRQNWTGGRNFQSSSSDDESWKRDERKTFDGKSYDILITGLRQIRNPNGSLRAMTYAGSDPEDLVGKAHVIPVPDWDKDPDGSKGYTKDSLVVSSGIMFMEAANKKETAMAISANALPRSITLEEKSTEAGTGSSAPQPQIRTNFNETAFFFPDLTTDSAGNISIGFTMPDALTQWKFQALAHTKDLAFGYTTTSIVTQKPLMVQPNAPRFLREGDKMEFSAKVVNMTDTEQTGTVQLELFNAATNQPADGWFRNMYPVQYFTAEAKQSTVVRFSIDIPYQYNSALVYRFVAKSGNNSDGEEASLPVLTNSMLVTESMPLPIRGNGSKNFKFEKLLQSSNSETLQQHALTVEFTTNPAWYAVQALPYLTDYPYECAEQTFNRYYANALASMIAGASPKLKAIVSKWNTTDTAALLSNLQKNQELKAVLLEETPWVLQAKTEAQQKKDIALLFDMVRMGTALASSFEKLKEMQNDGGGFVWFKGGPDDRYITQYILSGIGHLKKLHALSEQQQKDWKPIISNGIRYLDRRIKEDYDNLIKNKVKLDQNNLGYTQVQYLYLRSLFNDYDLPGTSFTAVNYYRKQSSRYWLQQNKYMQGMIALSLFRTGDVQTAKDILKSLKENAIINEELGMYWKDNTGGYYWHQAPIETQSLLIEAFSEISKDTKTIDDLKTWLIRQKQVQNWGTTKATAEACYALLLQGSDWISNTPEVTIRLGDKSIGSNTGQQEAGTGYFKQTIDGPFVHPSMGDISVRVSTASGAATTQTSWGAVYWQYFEHLDKITPAATPLKLSKKLFVEKNTDRGPVLEPIAENAYVKVGDKIKVRIELRTDRDMEYVHMKDMRASCMESVNVLSSYKWQDGLGYYESTKDASTNFFFNWLPKGTYVFEYPLFVTHAGNFSNGVTSIQCMYAPEFAAHSEGVRVNVEQ